MQKKKEKKLAIICGLDKKIHACAGLAAELNVKIALNIL
jgi:hypothetical protein